MPELFARVAALAFQQSVMRTLELHSLDGALPAPSAASDSKAPPSPPASGGRLSVSGEGDESACDGCCGGTAKAPTRSGKDGRMSGATGPSCSEDKRQFDASFSARNVLYPHLMSITAILYEYN